MKPFPFPEELIQQYQLNKASILENEVGHSSAQVYIVEDLSGEKLVVKLAKPEHAEELNRAHQLLLWLKDRLPVPQLIGYHSNRDNAALLTSYIEGEEAFLYGHKVSAQAFGHLLANALLQIHQLDTADFGLPFRMELLLEKGLDKLEQQQYDPQAPLFKGRSQRELVNSYRQLMQQDWQLVYCHGDFCLPNLKIKAGKVSGYYDLGNGGLFDRYYDLYWATWSLRYNKLAAAIPFFLEAYGIEELDYQKMKLMEYWASLSITL